MTMPLPEPAPAAPAGHPLPVAPASTDADLVARVHRGDGLAFELIMRRHNRRLFRLARSLLSDDAEAEDVLQEAYVRAYASLGGLADPQALPAWLARIVANEALGRLRAAAHVVSLEEHRTRARGETEDGPVDDPASDQPDPERLAASGELRRLLEAAVDALPEEFRAVFVLREVEGLSTAETAAYLALRPETVKTRLHRARRLLQEALGDRLLALSPSLFEFDGGRCDRVVARVLARLDQDAGPTPATSAVSPLAPLWWPRWLGRLLGHLKQRRR
jgi:RNA polymerase sigma-70 factor, ECF subfamily